ncbi:hypothetical protein [Fontivita pretiosa]|uniref:hypothetical protein n=1 Tax=Fontivita pretiosa TaxID=2989684 RepID=UPI003D1729E5
MIGRRSAAVLIGLVVLIQHTGFQCTLPRAHAASLPPNVITSTDPLSIRPQVQQFITEQTARLAASDPASHTAARDALVAEVARPPGGPQPTGPFLDVYCELLNDELLKLAKHTDPRVRLNAAILATRVAQQANSGPGEQPRNSRLVPAVTQFLADPNDAVALWAIKASKYLLPAVLANSATAKDNPLLAALIDCVQKHANKPPMAGPMAQAAYDAFRFLDPGRAGAKLPPSVISPAVDLIHKILAIRLKLYETGLPPSPANEQVATYLLTLSDVWAAQSDAQKLQTVQLMSDLLSMAAQRFQTASQAERAELAEVINKKGVSGALTVISTQIGSQPLASAVSPLLNVSQTTAASEVQQRAEEVYPALIKLPQFAKLKAPPKLGPAMQPPATEPATLPTAERQ